jgi:hypothetical protein
MIANARDQYLHPDTLDKPQYNKVYISIDPIQKRFRCADYATGIIDPDFQMIGSNEFGKSVGERKSTPDNPDLQMAGQFHMGKASYAKMSSCSEGKVASFYSNNGKEGLILNMLIRKTELGKELGWEDPPYRLPQNLCQEAREEKEIGLTVEVHEVIDKLLNAYYIQDLIGDQFGLSLKKGALNVYVKSTISEKYKLAEEWYTVDPATDYLIDTPEEILKLDGDHRLSFWLIADEKPPILNVRICIKDILICKIHIPNKTRGIINYDWIRPNAARDHYLDDERSEEMMRYLIPMIDSRFERLSAKKSPKHKDLRDLTKLFENMVKQVIDLYKRDPIALSGEYQELSDIRGNILRDDKNNIRRSEKKKGLISKTGQGKGKDEGQPEGEIVIPINGKHRGPGGGHGTHGGTKRTWKTDPAEGKEREYLSPNLNEQKHPPTGPIKPDFSITPRAIGRDKPVTYMPNASLLILNTDQPATYGILIMQKHYRQTSLGPFMAEALAEFITRNRPTPTSITEYRQMVNDIYTRSFFA